jgi:hypothetical protein
MEARLNELAEETGRSKDEFVQNAVARPSCDQLGITRFRDLAGQKPSIIVPGVFRFA